MEDNLVKYIEDFGVSRQLAVYVMMCDTLSTDSSLSHAINN